MSDFAAARAAAGPDYPEVVFVYQGEPWQAAEWFGDLPDGQRAVADLPRHLYEAFGVERGGMKEMFGPRAFACGVRATRKGHRIGRKVGDPWTLPLLVGVRDRAVVWEYRGRFAGDGPDPADIPHLLALAGGR